MKKFHYNTPILVGDQWYNMDGSVDRAKDYTLARFVPSDYAKAVRLNNKIIAALLCTLTIVTAAHIIL